MYRFCYPPRIRLSRGKSGRKKAAFSLRCEILKTGRRTGPAPCQTARSHDCRNVGVGSTHRLQRLCTRMTARPHGIFMYPRGGLESKDTGGVPLGNRLSRTVCSRAAESQFGFRGVGVRWGRQLAVFVGPCQHEDAARHRTGPEPYAALHSQAGAMSRLRQDSPRILQNA